MLLRKFTLSRTWNKITAKISTHTYFWIASWTAVFSWLLDVVFSVNRSAWKKRIKLTEDCLIDVFLFDPNYIYSNNNNFSMKHVLETVGGRSTFSTIPPSLFLIIPVVILNTHCGFLTLFESLVFTIWPVTILYDHSGVCHLFVIRVLLVASVVILNHNSCCPFFILFLLTTFVRTVSLLDYFSSFVQFSLFTICKKAWNTNEELKWFYHIA